MGIDQNKIIEFAPDNGAFVIAFGGHAVPISVDSDDWPGVIRAAKDLQSDIAKVTHVEPACHLTTTQPKQACLLIGTLGKSRLIDDLAARGKLDTSPIRGKWESTLIQVVDRPWPGVGHALVVAGSDKRGAIYGAYTLSEEAGVSPWYWWADVPVKEHQELYAKAGTHIQNSPAVKYRGIFINDEAPSLTNWVHEKFGNYNHKFYEHVFELLLRLKANCLWPAMWDNCFSEDDPLNPKLADEYGIVMGTSHVEPMMRADKEWNREGFSPTGWNYLTNPKELEDFWTKGIERNKHYESIVTVGMRGKVDTPMSETANVQLLENIVAAQRRILAKHMNKDLEKIPQVWCLYKEVQDYYEKGMRVPDDVTLLWADDNWGNIRRLPTASERNRKGGAGVYYHFDYVGGPRNYKWLNTVQIERVWEQMHLAYTSGANRIWIVNVGSMKVKEFPMEFFMRYAWDPKSFDAGGLKDYTIEWAARQFGPQHATEIGQLIEGYTKYNSRRKPELLSSDTYSLTNYDEADKVVGDYDNLAAHAKALEKKLPESYRAAFYELVEHPILACANLNDLYVSSGKNQLFAAQGRYSANYYAVRVCKFFNNDEELKGRFHTMLDAKWNHMMDQTHIGYTSWQQPDLDTMPELHVVRDLPGFGVAAEGDESAYPSQGKTPCLPELSGYSQQKPWIDVFSRGSESVSAEVKSRSPWIKLQREMQPDGDLKVWISADWSRVPSDAKEAQVLIAQAGQTVTVRVPIRPRKEVLHGFVESEGCVAIEAVHYSKAINGPKAYWKVLPNLGRTDGAVTVFPPTIPPQDPNQGGMRLEYKVYLFSTGPISIQAYLSPTQLLWPTGGLKYAISVDGEPPQTVNIHQGYTYFTPTWEKSVADNIIIRQTQHKIAGPGYHTVKYWAVDPGVVLQRLVIDAGGLRKSYLGPPESRQYP